MRRSHIRFSRRGSSAVWPFLFSRSLNLTLVDVLFEPVNALIRGRGTTQYRLARWPWVTDVELSGTQRKRPATTAWLAFPTRNRGSELGGTARAAAWTIAQGSRCFQQTPQIELSL